MGEGGGPEEGGQELRIGLGDLVLEEGAVGHQDLVGGGGPRVGLEGVWGSERGLKGVSSFEKRV